MTGWGYAGGAQDGLQDNRHDDCTDLETDSDIITHLDRSGICRTNTADSPHSSLELQAGKHPSGKIIPHYATPVRYPEDDSDCPQSTLIIFRTSRLPGFRKGRKPDRSHCISARTIRGTLQEENVHAAARLRKQNEHGRVHRDEYTMQASPPHSGTRSMISCARMRFRQRRRRSLLRQHDARGRAR